MFVSPPPPPDPWSSPPGSAGWCPPPPRVLPPNDNVPLLHRISGGFPLLPQGFGVHVVRKKCASDVGGGGGGYAKEGGLFKEGAMTSGFEFARMTSVLFKSVRWRRTATQTRPAPSVALRSPHRRGFRMRIGLSGSAPPPPHTAQVTPHDQRRLGPAGGGGWGGELACTAGGSLEPLSRTPPPSLAPVTGP